MKGKSIHSRISLIIATSIAIFVIFGMFLGTHASAQNPPNVKTFPTINKNPEMPSGTEATAIAILLKFHGLEVTKEVIGQQMPTEPLPITVNERLVGGDPNRAYIGDPFSEEGLGSYQQPMAKVLRENNPAGQVIDRTGRPFLAVISEVERGNPMIVWVTQGMRPASLTLFWWTIDNQLIQWHGNQSPVVLFDFDETNVYVSNPNTGQIESYNRAMFEQIWKDLGSRAIGIDASVPVPRPNTNHSEDDTIPVINESFDYEEERRKILKEIERQRDPSIAEKESEDGSQATGKWNLSSLGMWVVIVSSFIFLASFATLLMLTLKGMKAKKEIEPKPKDEDEDEDEEVFNRK